METGVWKKKSKGWVYKFKVDFFESNSTRDSRITWLNNGVGELYFNVKTEYLLNNEQNEKILGKLLQKAFNTKKYICVVDGRYKTKGENSFLTTVKFYFKVDERPTGVEDIPKLICDNIVPLELVRTDSKTGEVDFFTYLELRDVMSAAELSMIMKLCQEPANVKKLTGRKTVRGGYWSFA